MPHQSLDSEEAFSLVEILITIAIVGITFTAILGGMLVTITASAQQRKQATADTVARSAAEWVKDGVQNPYKNCAANTYSLTGLSVPSGFSVKINSTTMPPGYWNWDQQPVPASYAAGFQPSCPTPDRGLQRITIDVSWSDGHVSEILETVQVIKRTV